MPELCRFYGIVIRMYHGDHSPPHFYAAYGDEEIVVAIPAVQVLTGSLPR
jgi:hypothetical protein